MIKVHLPAHTGVAHAHTCVRSMHTCKHALKRTSTHGVLLFDTPRTHAHKQTKHTCLLTQAYRTLRHASTACTHGNTHTREQTRMQISCLTAHTNARKKAEYTCLQTQALCMPRNVRKACTNASAHSRKLAVHFKVQRCGLMHLFTQCSSTLKRSICLLVHSLGLAHTASCNMHTKLREVPLEVADVSGSKRICLLTCMLDCMLNGLGSF
jgi:hypothetical protein